MNTFKSLLAAAGSVLVAACATTPAQPPRTPLSVNTIHVTEYLPKDFRANAAEGYLPELQAALDAAAVTRATVVFPPMDYLVDSSEGLRVPSGIRLYMEGARFLVSPDLQQDGQVFLAEEVHEVSFHGGEIVGAREHWNPGTNIAGIRILGASSDIRIRDMRFRDLSSNGIGIFGENEERPAVNVRISGVDVSNCCNFYGDYLSEQRGPAEGSVREDQGGVCFYYVNQWLVEGSSFAGSQSDGTHFFHSHDGKFVNNRVTDSQMGGYFLEGCQRVLASGNTISGNGSRGVTIERDSLWCTLTNNVVEFSGREGCWAPDVRAIVVEGNIFRQNGRKGDKPKDTEICLEDTEKFATVTEDVLIADNFFYSDGGQSAVIRLSGDVRTPMIRGNLFAATESSGAGEYVAPSQDAQGNTYRGALTTVWREGAVAARPVEAPPLTRP